MNGSDYAETPSSFSWDTARRELAGLPGGGIHIAFEAVERNAQGKAAKQVAFRFLGTARQGRKLAYGELSTLTIRLFATSHPRRSSLRPFSLPHLSGAAGKVAGPSHPAQAH